MLNRAYATLVEDEPPAREKKEFTSAACQSSVVVGTAADPPHTPTAHRMRWIHVADASLRIEAILSGQAVALPTSDLTRIVAVQPPSALLSKTDPPSPTSGGQTAFLPPPLAFITPIPHTVVVLRSEPHPQHASRTRWWCASENRSRRLGRLSRQLMAKHLFSHNHRRAPANNATTGGGDEEDIEGGCACCDDHRWFFAPPASPHHLPSRHTNAPPPPTFSC